MNFLLNSKQKHTFTSSYSPLQFQNYQQTRAKRQLNYIYITAQLQHYALQYTLSKSLSKNILLHNPISQNILYAIHTHKSVICKSHQLQLLQKSAVYSTLHAILPFNYIQAIILIKQQRMINQINTIFKNQMFMDVSLNQIKKMPAAIIMLDKFKRSSVQINTVCLIVMVGVFNQEEINYVKGKKQNYTNLLYLTTDNRIDSRQQPKQFQIQIFEYSKKLLQMFRDLFQQKWKSNFLIFEQSIDELYLVLQHILQKNQKVVMYTNQYQKSRIQLMILNNFQTKFQVLLTQQEYPNVYKPENTILVCYNTRPFNIKIQKFKKIIQLTKQQSQSFITQPKQWSLLTNSFQQIEKQNQQVNLAIPISNNNNNKLIGFQFKQMQMRLNNLHIKMIYECRTTYVCEVLINHSRCINKQIWSSSNIVYNNIGYEVVDLQREKKGIKCLIIIRQDLSEYFEKILQIIGSKRYVQVCFEECQWMKGQKIIDLIQASHLLNYGMEKPLLSINIVFRNYQNIIKVNQKILNRLL